MNVKFDFLLVGFVKSGTTSLDFILRQDRRILLPTGTKETHFFDWNLRKDSDRIFEERYYPKAFPNLNKKLIGGIEPTYSFQAENVRNTWGKDVKIIFMMRNPILADYSLFKMILRHTSKKILRLYLKYPRAEVQEKYDIYTRHRIKYPWDISITNQFKYQVSIQKYLELFSKEQMHFILFEDFVKNPEQVISEVYNFLDLYPRKLDCKIKANVDQGVSKNYVCAYINHLLSKLLKMQESKLTGKNKISIWNFYQWLSKYTLKRVDNKMLDKTMDILKKEYLPTKLYVERLLNRSLDEIWF